MTTQYTSILKLALPVQGELSGTWGDVVNDNITSMVEEAIAGRAVIDSWTTNSHTLTSANGTTSESRCAMLEFTDTGTALTGDATVVCPTAAKIYICKNDAGQKVTIKTSAGTGVAIADGQTMFVFCDGTNVVEAVTSMSSLKLGTAVTSIEVTSILDEDDLVSDSATALATQQSIKAYVDAQVTAQDLDFGGDSGTGSVDLDSQSLTIAGTTNEIETSASGQTLTVGLPAAVTVTTSVTTPTVQVTDVKANDGTAAVSIADSTGQTTITDAVLTTADINGGTADNVVIGGTTAAAGSFTTVGATGNITSQGQIITDTINEQTATSGVTVDGVLLKDSQVNTDQINELTADAGVTIDSVLLKDDVVNATDIETSTISANDGTTAINIADSTGAVDIDTSLNVDGDVTADGLTVDGQGVFQTGTGASLLTLKNTDSSISGGEAIQLDWVFGDTANSTSWRQISRYAGNQYQWFSNIDDAGYILRMNLYEGGDFALYENTGATADFFWDSSESRLGIGTDSPDAILHLVDTGSTNIKIDSGEGGYAMIGENDGGDIYLQADDGNTSANSKIVMQIDDNEVLRVTNDGEVGINTINGNFYSTPRTWLTIVGDDSGPNSAANGTTNGAIQIQNVTNDVAMEMGISAPSADRYSWIQTTNTQNHSTVYKMAIQPLGGFVGIGETAPARTLHVTRSDATGTVVKVENSGAAGNATIEFADTSTTDTVSIGSVGNDLVLKSDDAGIKLSTTNDPATTSLYAARGGNILLGGTATPNWATDRIAFGKAGEQPYLQFGDAYLNISVNQYYDGTGNKYIEAGVSNRISMSSGGFYFQTAPNGSADAALSYDNSLFINNDGEAVFYSGNYVPVEIQRDAGAGTSGDYTTLLLKTITSATPTDQLGANLRFDVDGTLKGGITANHGGQLFLETSGTVTNTLYDVARLNSSSMSVAGENGTLTNSYGNSTRTNLQVDGSAEAIITMSHAGTAQGYFNTNPGSGAMDISAAIGGFRFLPSASATNKVEITSGGNLTFQNGNGIDFSASEGSGATSSLLDDYEEGTWTPAWTASGTNPTVTYSSQIGRYTKVGNMVFAWGVINGTPTAAGSGSIFLSGLPFNPNAAGEIAGGQIGYCTHFDSGYTPQSIHADNNNAYCWFYYNSTHGGFINAAVPANTLRGGVLYFSVIYGVY